MPRLAVAQRHGLRLQVDLHLPPRRVLRPRDQPVDAVGHEQPDRADGLASPKREQPQRTGPRQRDERPAECRQ